MKYFADLDISMMETHICVMERDGKVALEAKAATSAAAELTKAPTAQRIVFETGRMATTLCHGLAARAPGLGLRFGLNRRIFDQRCVVPGSTRLDAPAVRLLRRCCGSRRVVGKRHLGAQVRDR